MSHELRTPLNAILGFTQILNSNQSQNLNEQQLLFIDHIFGAGEHLLKLVNEAIDIASIESGQVSLSRQSVNLHEVSELCILQLSEMAEQRKVHVHSLSEDQSNLCVIADYARLQQVITHLLSNAIKYNKEGGTVTFQAIEQKNEMIRFSVTDTGRGIPKDEKEDIFAPFNRLNAHSQGIEGTGLGLTLTRHLLILMGGKISFSSTPDEGSTFIIELPQAQKGSPLLFFDRVEKKA